MGSEHRRDFSWQVRLHEDLMFNTSELGFILNSAEVDLKTIEDRIEKINRNMEEDGLRLSNLMKSRDLYASIVNKIKALKDEE